VISDNIRVKSIKGISIQSVVLFITKGIDFARTIVLVRLLLPEEFGTVAFVGTIIGFASLFTKIPADATIVQTKSDSSKMVDTAFTSQLLLGLLQTVLLVVLASFISAVLGKPEVGLLIKVMAVTRFVGVFKIPGALFKKELNFKAAAIPRITNTVVGTVATISLALLKYGVWSLIFGPFLGMISSLAALYVILPYRPKFKIERKLFRELFNFSWPLYLLSFSVWIYWNADDFMVGLFFGNEALGYYRKAFYLPYHFVLIKGMLGSVAFPAFSKIGGDKTELSNGFSILTRYTAILMFPFAAVFIPLAKPMILYLFGKIWLPAVNPFMIFTALAVLRTVFGNWAELYMSQGKSKILFYVHLPNSITLLILGPTLGRMYGITCMAAVTFFSALIVVPLSVYLAKRLVDFSVINLLWRPTVAFSITFCLGLFIRPLVTNLLVFIIATVGLFILYFGIIALLDRSFISKVKGYLQIAVK